jgi:D-glycero-D-manno-heptose 1,7-bisphosphate phosphatase
MDREQCLIILDRDGVLNQTLDNPNEPLPDSPMVVAEVAVFPWVPAALRRLTRAGYRLAVASNQPAFAKGKTSLDNLRRVHERVLELAESEGAVVSSSHLCFHRAEDACACRKPKPGLLLEALAGPPSALAERSWMVGDRATDVLAGTAAGVRTALLGDAAGRERGILLSMAIRPSFHGADLQEFTDYLLSAPGQAQFETGESR